MITKRRQMVIKKLPGKRHLSEETRRKISAAKKANHPMKGRHWSEEVKQKLRVANLGQKRSAKTRRNISLGLKKKWRILKLTVADMQ